MLLMLLVVTSTAAQAQSVGSFYALSTSQRPAATAGAPVRANATEAPFYIKAYGFYSLLTPGTQINYDLSQAQSSLPNSFKATKTSLGAGPRAGLGVGFIVSDFINVGIDADMLFGSAIKTNTNVFSGSGTTFSNYNIHSTTTLRVLSIIPNVTFKALSRPSFYIYNRLGLIGGVVLDYKAVAQTVETSSKGAVTTSENTSKYTKNSLATGYQAALGVQFRLSQTIRAFAEIVAYNQSFKPREVQSTGSSTSNGKTTVSSFTSSYKDQGDSKNADEFPSINVAINSVGVGAGLSFRF